MNKLLTLIIVTSFVFSSPLHASDYYGTYISKPEVFPGFDKPHPEVLKKAIERMTWKMEITKNEITIWIKPDSDPLVIPYTEDGKYLLGTNIESDVKAYIPFYVENNETIHGNNTIFFKINE